MIIINDKHEETRKIIRAVIYIRFSSHKQADSYSIEYQEEECLKYIERKGYKFVKIYIDQAKTAKKTAGREALEEMLYDAGRNKFDKIVVFSFSRSFRNTRDALNTNHDLMEKYGIPIESVIEPIDLTTAHGKFSGINLFAMHELQSDITAAHAKAGMYIAAKQGYFLGGYVPFGYDTYETGEFTRGKPRKKYCVNEEEAEIVKLIFGLYAENYSLNYIRDEMIRRNVIARKGNVMSIQTMCRMLRNVFYIGIREYEIEGYDKLFLEGAVPAIIDIPTWNAVQMKHKQNALPQPRRTKRFYPLTGKIFCADCGAHYTGMYKNQAKQPHIGGYAYYACSKKKGYHLCKARNIRKDILEEYCIKQIKERILTPDKIKEIAAFIVSQTDSTPQLLKEELNAAENEKRKALDNIKQLQLQNLSANEAVKEANNELIAEFSAQVEKLNEKLARLDTIEGTVISEEFVIQYLEDCALNIDSPDPHILKSVFDKLIEKIVISDDKVELHLIVFPLTRIGDNNPQGHPHWALSAEIARKTLNKFERP